MVVFIILIVALLLLIFAKPLLSVIGVFRSIAKENETSAACIGAVVAIFVVLILIAIADSIFR